MLCFKYNNRIYKGGNNDIDLDGKVMKLSSENKILAQKNDELREKNHKRKSGNLDSLSLKKQQASPMKKRNQHRSITNAFTTS